MTTKMLVKLYLSTIAILFLFRSAFSLAVEASTLTLKKSALRNLASYLGKNGETTCSDDIEEIIYFLKIGDEDIERTDVKDVVIVVGASGVGKSTLTQFVANETNTLRAACSDWFECSVIDDSGTIGEDLVSRTFLPNLVLHVSKQTPFYDMPGFNDNRNESMEIANSFFMQQILEDANTVKILVLAKFDSFQNSAKSDFQNLLRNLVDLIKSPAKFRGAMAVVSTMAPYEVSHTNIIGRNTQFLKESLLPNITTLFEGEEEYIRGSTEIVENWLESDTENSFDAKYYSYFLTPNNTGPLLEDPLLFENKKFLEEVIWDRLKFVPKETGDFGLPMSARAKLKLMEVGSCISNTLATEMGKFADYLDSYVRTNVSNLVDGKETDTVHIAELLTNLTNSDFSFDNVEGQPLSTHLKKLLKEVNNLVIPSLEETKQLIDDTLTFIEFIELTVVEIQFDPRLWVIKMSPLSENLKTFIEQTGTSTLTALAIKMDKFAVDLENYIRTNVSNLIDGNETDVVHISELLTNLTTSNFSFENMEGQPLSTHLEKLLSEVNSLEIPSFDVTRQQIEDTLTFIRFTELTNVKNEFDARLWVIELKSVIGNLVRHFDSQAKELQDEMISWFAGEAKVIAEIILTKIESLNDIYEKENLLKSEVDTVRDMFEVINSVKPTKKLTEFIGFFSSEYDMLRGVPSDSSIPYFNALSALEILDDFSWSNRDWTTPSITKLQYPLEIERDLTIFLRALFKDLSQPIIQTGENSAIYTWWSNRTHLTKGNFNCLYSKIKIQEFTSTFMFLKSRIKEFVFYTTKGRKRLEFLLDFILKNVYDCPNSSEIIVTSPVISLDRILARCINQQQTTVSIVLLATHKIYANWKIVGSEQNPNNNINVILMSPELIVSNNSEIDLSGKVGQQGVQGKPAGTQYLLFQNITTNDGSNLTRITLPTVTGGHGVHGAVGSSGRDELITGTNNFNANTDDCAAWIDGFIQIRNYENTCNDHTCSSMECRCYSYPEVAIDIKGKSGSIGGNGGAGKDGSCGGAGGQSYSIDSNTFLSTKTAANGLQGKNGDGGAGGPGGLGGPYGPTLHVLIRNVFDVWGLQRVCEEFHRESEPSSQRGPSGNNGSEGKPCMSLVTRKSVNSTEVTNHFASFKAALNGLETNEFLFSQAKSLLNLLGSGQPLG